MKQALYTCVFCGKPVTSLAYLFDIGETMKAKQYCYTCNFWHSLLQEERQPVRAWYKSFTTREGHHYTLHEPGIQPHNSGLGFMGHWYIITNLSVVTDYDQIITNDLYGNGLIDPLWRPSFGVTAAIQGVDSPRLRKLIATRFDLKTGFPLAKEE